MMIDWCLEVWGDFACFTRPEMKVERVSYDVMTPSAARAIYEAILWKPAIRWHIQEIEVLQPIRFISVRRNEVGKTMGKPTKSLLDGETQPSAGFYIEDVRQQRAGLLLRDVRYRIHAWFEFIPPEERQQNHTVDEMIYVGNNGNEMKGKERMDETPAKYAAMFERRAKKGQCFHRPYLGCREFACCFSLVDPQSPSSMYQPIDCTKDLGWMLYDMDFSAPNDIHPEFFHAYLTQGIMITDRRSVEVRS